MCKVWILDFGDLGFWILDWGFWIGTLWQNFGCYIRQHKKRRLCTPNRVGGFSHLKTRLFTIRPLNMEVWGALGMYRLSISWVGIWFFDWWGILQMLMSMLILLMVQKSHFQPPGMTKRKRKQWNYLSTGAGFLPSTGLCSTSWLD